MRERERAKGGRARKSQKCRERVYRKGCVVKMVIEREKAEREMVEREMTEREMVERVKLGEQGC